MGAGHRRAAVPFSGALDAKETILRLRSIAVCLVLSIAVVSFGSPAHASPPLRAASNASTTCAASGSHVLSKTRFLLHAGLAFGAFHRYIYKPLKAGGFSGGASGRTKTFLKAAGSAVLVLHELRQAKKFAESDPTLCKLVGPLDGLNANLTGLVSKLKNGSATSSDLESVNNAVSQVSSQSSAAGATITDK